MTKKINFERKIISISILGILLLLSGIHSTDLTISSLKDDEVPTKIIPNYTVHDPILIEYSSNFTDYGFDGAGTSGDPYLIANLSITTGAVYSIYIDGVSDYFIIENCYTEGSNFGIYIEYCYGAIVRNNSNINHWVVGVYMLNCDDSQILNNTVTDCQSGVFIEHCYGAIVQDNILTNNEYGIHSWYSDSIDVTNNTCQNNFVAMYLGTIYHATISKNTLINNGLYLNFESVNEYFDLTFSDNTVNGLPILIFLNETGSSIDSSSLGQIILLNCSGVTVSNPLPVPTINYGVHLFFSNSCIIKDTKQMNNIIGILAYYSPDTEISNNDCSSDYYDLSYVNKNGPAIHAERSNNSIIKDNICDNFGQGVSIFRSFNVDILRNTCDHNDEGIGIYSQDVNIKENTLDGNFIGISIIGSSTLTTSNVFIESNTITGSSFYGIELRSYTANNIIHHNYLIDNGGITSQASDDGANNIWYDTSTNEGNYYSDWSGSGSYSIDGSAGSVDPYPLSSVSEYSFASILLFVVVTLCITIVPLLKKRK
jgi:parallel beta-helix repeat protein